LEQAGFPEHHPGWVGVVCYGCQDRGAIKTAEELRKKIAWLTELANEIDALTPWPSPGESRRLDEKFDREVV